MESGKKFFTVLRQKFGGVFENNKPFILLELSAIAAFPLIPYILGFSTSIVPLVLAGWFSLWMRKSGWRDVGLRRPAKPLAVIVSGIGFGIAAVFLGETVVTPLLLDRLGTPDAQAAGAAVYRDALRGNLFLFLFLLAGIWVLAAIGEEMVFRGYAMNRVADLAGRNGPGWGIALAASSAMFSVAHGVFNGAVLIGGFIIGLVEGGLYLAGRRNLWLPIVVHGTWDTVLLVLFYTGVSWR
jgi:membrane protease YdiL (CAAX protease family)